MNIEFYNIPESIAIIRDWYTPDELEKVWAELDVVCSPFVLNGAEDRAAQVDGVLSKKGHGIFLDVFYYQNRHRSHILALNNKIYDSKFTNALIDNNIAFKFYLSCNADNTLANYYEEDGEYNFHYDNSVYTANIVLWREPQKFDGGKLLFSDKDLDFDVGSNDMVIFPGHVKHRVTKMKMHQDYTPWKSGRYSIVNFGILKN